MTEFRRPRGKYVIGPDGSPLTIADLPPPSTNRWIARRKAEVVAAVREGLLSLEEACSRYGLTVEEYLSWQDLASRDSKVVDFQSGLQQRLQEEAIVFAAMDSASLCTTVLARAISEMRALGVNDRTIANTLEVVVEELRRST